MFKIGTRLKASTHKDFLNQYFGKDYLGYGKCSCQFIGELYIWMIKFNKNNSGYKNVINGDEIKEFFSETEYKYKNNIENKKFLVFEIIESKTGREYEYKGLFKYEDTIEKYNLYKRVLDYPLYLIPFYYPSFNKETNEYVPYIQYDFCRGEAKNGTFISLDDINISSYILDNMRVIIMKQLHDKEIETNEIFKSIDELEDMLDQESIKYYHDGNDDYLDTLHSTDKSILDFSKEITNNFIKEMKE